jgi:hypothetical protein
MNKAALALQEVYLLCGFLIVESKCCSVDSINVGHREGEMDTVEVAEDIEIWKDAVDELMTG